MIFVNKKIIACLFVIFMFVDTRLDAVSDNEFDRDILAEFKGAVFVPTNQTLKDLYNNCPEFGVEVTGNLFDRLYAFTSVDFLRKEGQTIALANSTQLSIVNLALGVKYFVPFSHGDFYLGLGVEPTFLSTIDQFTAGIFKHTQWSCGGIAKSGVIIDIPNSFFIDLFFDYSFVKSDSYSGSPVQLNETHLDGCLFGIGIGYRFH